jgi:hypothetical protein
MSEYTDAVLSTCRRRNGLAVRDNNTRLYSGFLERLVFDFKEDTLRRIYANGRIHCEVYCDLSSDALYLFSALMRQSKVKTGFNGSEDFLDKSESLHYLRVCGNIPGLWFDERLFNVYRRRENAFGSLGLPRYTSVLNLIGSDPAVVRLWKRPLRYEKDISWKFRR